MRYLMFIVTLCVTILVGCGGSGGVTSPDAASNVVIDSIYADTTSGTVLSGKSATFPIVVSSYTKDGSALPTDTTFRVVSGPSGMQISGSNIVYTAPTVTANTTVSYTIRATQGDASKDFSGTISVVAYTDVASGTVGSAGGTVSGDQWGDTQVRIPAGGAQDGTTITISKGYDADGNEITIITPSGTINNAEIILPDPNLPTDGSTRAKVKKNELKDTVANQVWIDDVKAYFLYPGPSPDADTNQIEVFSGNRVENHFSVEQFITLFHIKNRTVYKLLCNMPKDSASLTGKSPVLFVHGYTPFGNTGGDSNTWGSLPTLLQSSDRLVCEYRWSTAQSFRKASDDLETAINLIKSKTGMNVNIVAHSFGGVLARTYLQGLGEQKPYNNDVNSLVTIGTPHSGIAAISSSNFYSTYLPDGQDSDMFRLCRQVSCYEAGHQLASFLPPLLPQEVDYSLEPTAGYVATSLADVTSHPLPDIPILALIGLSTNRSGNTKIDGGDKLISYEGQRFAPSLTESTIAPLLDGSYGGAHVTEKILGFESDVHPGDANTFQAGTYNYDGYQHSYFNGRISKDEVNVACTQASGCEHDTYIQLATWLNNATMNAPADMSSAFINLSLTVRDINLAPISGVQVRFKNITTGELSDYATTDVNGNATAPIGFSPYTHYIAYAYADGYRGAVSDNEYVTGQANNLSANLGVVLLTSTVFGTGNFNGKIIDAVTGNAISTVAYELYNTVNGALIYSGTTDSSGLFSFSSLPYSRYKLVVIKNGYISEVKYFDYSMLSSSLSTFDMSPVLSSGEMRIILNWGLDPADLDSHLIKFNSAGTELYHLAYYSKTDATTGDNLDLDDVTSYGPETVTIQNLDSTARYLYMVHHYAGSGSITTTSGATVTVNYGSSSRVFNAPTSGDGIYWKVFEINNGVIQECTADCISSTIFRSSSKYSWINLLLHLPKK